MRLILLLSCLLAQSANAWSPFGPKTYAECILENMKGISNDTAAEQVKMACMAKFGVLNFSPTAGPSTECVIRELTKDESKLVSGDVGWFGRELRVNFYNGNKDIRVSGAKIAIRAKNIEPEQEYTLRIEWPIRPLSSGLATAMIQTTPDKASFFAELTSLQTCKTP